MILRSFMAAWLILFSSSAISLEPITPTLQFLFPGDEKLKSIDINGDGFPELVGETIVTAVEASGLDNIRGVTKFRLQFRDQQTNSQIYQFTQTTKTFPFPDPYGSAGADFYLCGEGGDDEPTRPVYENFSGDADWEDVCEGSLSAIVANSGGGRYLVTGNTLQLKYINYSPSYAENYSSAFKIHVVDLSNGNLLWARTYAKFRGASSGDDWEFDFESAAVGDFVSNGAGNDEIQLVYGRDTAPGIERTLIDFLDITTGAKILTRAYNTSVPAP